MLFNTKHEILRCASGPVHAPLSLHTHADCNYIFTHQRNTIGQPPPILVFILMKVMSKFYLLLYFQGTMIQRGKLVVKHEQAHLPSRKLKRFKAIEQTNLYYETAQLID